MAVTTLTFLLFFAACFACYWLVKKRGWQNMVLVAFSYLFYATWDSRFGLLLLATSLIDYSVGLGLARAKSASVRRALLALSICSGLGALALFKYFNFFVENFSRLAELVGWHVDPVLTNFILPVGISFYTFKSLSYTIDVYRRDIAPTANLVAYLAYVAFFPQLLAGPIDRAGNLLSQLLTKRRFDYQQAVSGCRQILRGLCKKLVLADNLAIIVNLVYIQAGKRSGPELLFATICFAWQIYGDFSGYSDIAIGLGKLLGLQTDPNFDYPYFSQSPAEFWRRWHISLTSWFRDYLFFPLGGLRRSRLRAGINVMVTFLVSGLWHGASWNFVLWGGLNGVAVLPALVWRRKGHRAVMMTAGKLLPHVLAATRILMTFLLISLLWIFFRMPDLSMAWLILKKIFVEALYLPGYLSIRGLLHPMVDYPLAGKILPLLLIGFIMIEWAQKQKWVKLDARPVIIRWLAYNAAIFLIFYFGTYWVNPFYYYQF